MSRLEGIAKAGYYPTPPSVVERVAALVRPARPTTRQAVRLLDPCCGTGAALRKLADAAGGETYGVEIVEIEGQRAEEARNALDHALHASAFAVRLAHDAFSCLWLNPPYDRDDAAKRLVVSARYLAGHYTRFTCYRFPDPEYADFGQVVLLAVKRNGAVGEARWKEQIDAWASEPLPVRRHGLTQLGHGGSRRGHAMVASLPGTPGQ